jgi:hypothetical protein
MHFSLDGAFQGMYVQDGQSGQNGRSVQASAERSAAITSPASAGSGGSKEVLNVYL